jgi:hypothetical protein
MILDEAKVQVAFRQNLGKHENQNGGSNHANQEAISVPIFVGKIMQASTILATQTIPHHRVASFKKDLTSMAVEFC